MAVKYIDFLNGLDTNDGNTPSTAWQTLEKFCGNEGTWGLAAGDICWVRRGTTQTEAVNTTLMVSGSLTAPIQVLADNAQGNKWSDRSTLGQTATLTQGSKTVTGSDTWTGVAAGDVVFFGTELTQPWEVASVSGTTLTLYLPYTGNLSGAGITTYRMPSAPTRNYNAAAYYFNGNNAAFWIVDGLRFYNSTSSLGTMYNFGYFSNVFNCIFDTNPSYMGLKLGVVDSFAYVKNCRVYNCKYAFYSYLNTAIIENLLTDCNNIASSVGLYLIGCGVLTIRNFECLNATDKIGVAGGGVLRILGHIGAIDTSVLTATSKFQELRLSEINADITANNFARANFTSSSLMQRDDVEVRAGGGLTSIKITPPVTNAFSNFDGLRLNFFEYPIYADTSSKEYRIYYKMLSTDFTAVPAASEFFIEADFIPTSGNAVRVAKKSTTTPVADSTWNNYLSLTVQPGQSGLLILRGYYGKIKESGMDNYVWIDTKPVVV